MSSRRNIKHPLRNGIISKCTIIWGEAVYEVQGETLDGGFRLCAIKVRMGDEYGQDLEETPICETLDEAFHKLDRMLAERLEQMLKNEEADMNQGDEDVDAVVDHVNNGAEMGVEGPRRSGKAARKQRAMHAAEMYRQRKAAERDAEEEAEEDQEESEDEAE